MISVSCLLLTVNQRPSISKGKGRPNTLDELSCTGSSNAGAQLSSEDALQCRTREADAEDLARVPEEVCD
jgi:hypothetical protein